MGKKRKSIATSLDEVDRTMYSSFSSAANSLSHLYTLSMNHQKLSFHAGERHSLEKLCQWILRQQESGSRVATVDVLNYIQNELDYCGEEPCMSPRAPQQHQQTQPVMHVTGSGFPVTSGFSGQTVVGQRISEGGNYSSGVPMGNRSNELSFLHQQSRDPAAFGSIDSVMDMHAE